MNRRRALGSIAAGLLLAKSTARAQGSRVVTIALGGDGLHYVLHHLANAGGFLAREGVVPNFVSVQSGPRMTAAVIGGSADVALAAVEHVVRASSQGAALSIVATVYDIFPISIVVSNAAMQRNGLRRELPIDERVRRFKGLRLAVTSAGSGTDTLIRTLLAVRGMDADRDVTIQPLGTPESMMAALERGVIDGFSYPAPYVQIAERKGLGKVLIDPFRAEVPEISGMPYNIMIAGQQAMRERSDLLAATIRAYAKAIAFFRTDADAAKRLVAANFANLDADLFDEAYAIYAKGVPVRATFRREQLERTMSWMNIREKEPLKVRFEDVVRDSLSIQADREIGNI